jgi:hypothetical protein
MPRLKQIDGAMGRKLAQPIETSGLIICLSVGHDRIEFGAFLQQALHKSKAF